MPPSQAIQIERMVKRVDNAIHNPAFDSRAVTEALTLLKSVTHPFREDYDRWVHLAIENGDDRKIAALFTVKYIANRPYTRTALNSLFENSPHTIPAYVRSRLFNPDLNSGYYIYDILVCYWLDEANGRTGILPHIYLFFKQPKTVSIIMRLIQNKMFRKKEQFLYMNANPILRKRKHMRKVLLRFWLLTTKPLLRSWREALYVPGTGSLYKKAAASFNHS